MSDQTKKFMVGFDLPTPLSEEFISLIPVQRTYVNELFYGRKLSSYSLSLDRSKIWATFEVPTEGDVEDIIDTLPLSQWMEYTIYELAFHDQVYTGLPQPSLN